MLAIAINVEFSPGIVVYDAHINYFRRVGDVKHMYADMYQALPLFSVKAAWEWAWGRG